ncbi:MAG TPA: hypothetical protein VK365_07180 [Nocardioidaceae bacterium]|nr:hypothetical protein [Nocardioidaceae bacterium]
MPNTAERRWIGQRSLRAGWMSPPRCVDVLADDTQAVRVHQAYSLA